MRRIKNSRRIEYVIASAVSAITFLVYLPSLRNGLINWDDNMYISNNPHIRSINQAFIKWAFSDFSTRNWYPLTWLSFALDYSAWGLSPIGYHLTNAVLHSVNVFLVAVLAIRLLEAWEKGGTQNGARTFSFLGRDGKLVAACATGLLFGIHPLHVESVAWASERKDVLSGLFFLLSILMYIKYCSPSLNLFPGYIDLKKQIFGAEDRNAWRKWPGVRRFRPDKMYFFCLSFFVLALLSKPMAVSLPLVLLILDWHPFGRINSFNNLTAALIEKIPFFAFSLASSVMTIKAQGAGGAMAMSGFVPLSIRVTVAVKSVIAYLGKMILPLKLFPFYPYPPPYTSFLAPKYVFPFVFLICITALCLYEAKKNRLYLASWLYYVVTLMPVLGIVQVSSHAMADRYTYLPSLGPFFLAGMVAAWIWTKMAALKKGGLIVKAAAAVAALLLLSMSYLTVRQIGIWRNSLVFWSYVIDKDPEQVSASYVGRGLFFEEAGQWDKALADFCKAVSINPGDFTAYNNRGVLYLKLGELEPAIHDFKTACGLGDSRGCNNLQVVRAKLGKRPQ